MSSLLLTALCPVPVVGFHVISISRVILRQHSCESDNPLATLHGCDMRCSVADEAHVAADVYLVSIEHSHTVHKRRP
eukprot:COSAG02_NODE_408_length_22892_cov_35.212785_16_plen_77_part_00